MDFGADASAHVTVQPAAHLEDASSSVARVTAHQELARLPSAPLVFSQLDYQIMSSILQAAEQAAGQERMGGTGNGQVCMHSHAALPFAAAPSLAPSDKPWHAGDTPQAAQGI